MSFLNLLLKCNFIKFWSNVARFQTLLSCEGNSLALVIFLQNFLKIQYQQIMKIMNSHYFVPPHYQLTIHINCKEFIFDSKQLLVYAPVKFCMARFLRYNIKKNYTLFWQYVYESCTLSYISRSVKVYRFGKSGGICI